MSSINKLEKSFRAGLARAYFDGERQWSKRTVHGMINPRGMEYSLTDPEVLEMLKAIESEGLIKIVGIDEIFIEILPNMNPLNRKETLPDLELMDWFILRMQELYEVKVSLAQHIYKVWDIKTFSDKESVDLFLTSQTLVGAIIPNGSINILKRYTQKDLQNLQTQLEDKSSEAHEFIDTRYGYRWRQVYHGMGDCWLDLYEVDEPDLENNLNRIARKLANKEV